MSCGMPRNARTSPETSTERGAAKKRLLCLVPLALALLFPAQASADEYCQLRPKPIASVLIVHAGGWRGGSAASTLDLCLELSVLGYRARSVEYPLGTIPGSIEYTGAAAAQEARSGRPVYALGTSAGGTIAEYLAVRGQVDGALAIAPVSDLLAFPGLRPGWWEGLGMTPELRRRWSPYYNIERPVPLRIVHSRQDEVVPHEQSMRMAAKCGAPCELVTLEYGGSHAASLAWQAIPALQWFYQRALRPLRRTPPTADAQSRRPAPTRKRRWQRVASRAFPGHCPPVRLRYESLPRPHRERIDRRRCSVVLDRRLRRRPAWVQCTAVVHAFGHLTPRRGGRHSADRHSVISPRILHPYRGPRSRCPRR